MNKIWTRHSIRQQIITPCPPHSAASKQEASECPTNAEACTFAPNQLVQSRPRKIDPAAQDLAPTSLQEGQGTAKGGVPEHNNLESSLCLRHTQEGLCSPVSKLIRYTHRGTTAFFSCEGRHNDKRISYTHRVRVSAGKHKPAHGCTELLMISVCHQSPSAITDGLPTNSGGSALAMAARASSHT